MAPRKLKPIEDSRVARPQKARHDTAVKDPTWDAYRNDRQPTGAVTCPTCGAAFRNGRWTWEDATGSAARETCPACRRIADSYPEGFLTLSGSFIAGHREEILNLIENEAEAEKAEHPLNRIMDQADEGEKIVIRTTDNHLPRRIGEALKHAYGGRLILKYPPEEAAIRVSWTRQTTSSRSARSAATRH